MYTSRAAKSLLIALRRVESELMAQVIFDIDSLMQPMSDEEVARVFPNVVTKAPNFNAYQMKLNASDIGNRFSVAIPEGEDVDASVRALKFNLNEAAKHRTVWKDATLTEDEAAQYAANKKIDRFDRADGTHVTRIKGEWKQEVAEPVLIRWTADTREVEREVTKDGKTEKKTIKVPTRLYVTIAASEVRTRTRKKKEETSAPAPVDGAVVPETPSANGEAPVAEPVAA